MTEANTPNESIKLSKEQALQEYEQLFSQEAANIITAYRNMDRLLFLLKTLGYSQSEAITKMANDAKEKGLKGFSETTIRLKLKDESKKQTKPGPRKSNGTVTSSVNKTLTELNPNRRLVVPEEPTLPPRPQVVREAEIVEPKEEFNVDKVDEYIANVPKEPEPQADSKIIEVVFDPAPIDRDRTQVFIMQIDIVTKKVKTYKTVGRRTIR